MDETAAIRFTACRTPTEPHNHTKVDKWFQWRYGHIAEHVADEDAKDADSELRSMLPPLASHAIKNSSGNP